MLPVLLGQIGLPMLVKLLSGVLSEQKNPMLQAAGQGLQALHQGLDGQTLSAEELSQVNVALQERLKAEIGRDQANFHEVNQSLRTEITSHDPYVRRMRPTFGYIMALSWGAQMGAVSYVMIAEPERAAPLIQALSSLGMIWGIGLSVLGVYVYKRSQEKQGR